MSTTLLYHTYSIRGYRYQSTKKVAGGIEFREEKGSGYFVTQLSNNGCTKIAL